MSTSTAIKPMKLSETQVFSFLINYAFENNFSIALWRLPDQTSKYAILTRSYQLIKDNTIEDLAAGFIFAPFDKEKESIFLSADFTFVFENDELKSPENANEINSSAWLAEQITQQAKVKSKINYSQSVTKETSKSAFINLVNKGLLAIEKGEFEKVVLSRTKTIDLPAEFDIIQSFQNLCKVYSNALVSFVSIPGTGSWLGATPEVLVSIENKTTFKTVALAGTKPYNTTLNLRAVAWTQKEIEEQALVERYIISCFKAIRLREYEEHGPKTVIAGNLMHLKSEFSVDMKATNFPQLGSVMLKLLHPTSAVCGMPLATSLEFIKKNEDYDREFYSGYLGPININNATSIFVNLRCMQLLHNKGICYAGAGVTNDSNPDEEWAETELKLNTLLSVII